MTDRSRWTPEQFEQERTAARERQKKRWTDPAFVAKHNAKRRTRHAKAPEKKREYDKKWAAARKDDPEFVAARRATYEAWKERNPGKSREHYKTWIQKHRGTPSFVELTRKWNKKRYEAQKDCPEFKAENRLRVRKWNEANPGRYAATMRERRHNDPIYRMVCTLRTRLRIAIRRALTKKAKNTFPLIGCDPEFLVAHLEGKFRDGMTWENYGLVWHVDHIRPCRSFDLSDAAQQAVCFNWKNLQPLLVAENLTKAGRYIEEESRAA